MFVARRLPGWFNEDYAIVQGNVQRGRLRPDSGGRFLIELGAAQYEGSSKVPFEQYDPYGLLAVTLVDQSLQRVASAYAPDLRRWQYTVPFRTKVYSVRYSMEALFGLSFPLYTDDKASGTLRGTRFWREEWTAEVPDELPLFSRCSCSR